MEESGDLINGLKHMADDHPCCKETIHAAIQRIEELEPPLDHAACSVYSDHRGNRFNFNDVVEGWSTGRIGRLVQVRKGCGQFGSDVYFLRTADRKLCTLENEALKHSDAMIPKCDDTQEMEYTIRGEWPETGFVVETPAQPKTPGSFSMMISSPNTESRRDR